MIKKQNKTEKEERADLSLILCDIVLREAGGVIPHL